MEGKDAEILNKCTPCMACGSPCPTGADPSDLIFKMQEKIGTCLIVVVGKPLCEEAVRAFEGREGSGRSKPGTSGKPALSFDGFRFDYQELIPGDPDKPALSLDAFRFDYFPEGTFDSRLLQGLAMVRGGQYASLVGYVHMGGESLVERYGQRVLDNLASLGKDIVYIHNEGFVLAHVKA